MNAGPRMVSVITTQESEIIRYFVSHAEREAATCGVRTHECIVTRWPPVVMSHVSIIMHPGIITPVVTPATMAIRRLDNWRDFQFQCPAASARVFVSVSYSHFFYFMALT